MAKFDSIEELNLYKAVVVNANDAVVVTDANIDRSGPKIIYVNNAFVQLTGYSTEEAIGQTPRILQGPDTDRETLDKIRAALEAGTATHQELLNYSKDGRPYWIDIKIAPVTDDEGVIRNFIAIERDVTAQKMIEQQLREAKEMAEAANRAKSEFVANMSHEIRTPLNAIVGMTGLLSDTDLTPEQQDFVMTIRQGGDSLLGIINDILDFSKIEAKQMEIESLPFSLRDCINSAMDLVSGKAKKNELDLVIWVEPSIPDNIVGDPTRLRQIFVNLLSNAIKFTEMGEVYLGGRLVGNEAGILVLEFIVRDTGIGIPEERMDRLFKSFSQVDSSTTRRFGGTGLGLVITQQLIEMMGGDIEVESEEGVGTTFRFTLQTAVANEQTAYYLKGDQPVLQNLKLLVVDDNASSRLTLKQQTEVWGMQCAIVASAAEALALLYQHNPFDIIILDKNIPGIDGLMLAEIFNKMYPDDSCPLILLSAAVDVKHDPRAKHFSAFLTKPVKAISLHRTLLQVLGQLPTDYEDVLTADFDRQLANNLPLRILVAEDNRVNQKIAMLNLARLGYQAEAVVDGIEVTEAVSRQIYDVILMDVQMPNMDGLEATQWIRQNLPAKQQPYIIAVTAHATIEDRRRCFDVGMNAYISKPFLVKELIAALRASASFSLPSKSQKPLALVQPVGKEVKRDKRQNNAVMESEITSPVITDSVLEQLLDLLDNQAELDEMLEQFFKEVEILLKDIEVGIDQGDDKLVQRAAHTMRSLAAQVGALSLSELAKQLEQTVASNTFDKGDKIVADMHHIYGMVKQKLQSYISK
ncbi:MAG TPA: response regulator [Anaerolineae bacterium]|nr:response regulator [Anaerolineae bacterium]